MLNHRINLLPAVRKILLQLTKTYELILITRGDLLHQEQNLAQSGLERYFEDVHIVSAK